MNARSAFFILLGCAVLAAAFFLVRGSATPDGGTTHLATLRFSTTQEWDPELFAKSGFKTLLRDDWTDILSLPDPPANDSKETARELAMLVEQKNERTPETLQAIQDELRTETILFGDYAVREITDPSRFPKTARLLFEPMLDLEIVILKFKRQFDRVRPSFLEHSIEPVIPVPGHPSYPSGHSTQAHFVAYVLSELAPERHAEFEARAWEIGVHREIAGVHYRSDTEAGKLLAEQFFAALTEDPVFVQSLEEARVEWE